MLSNVPRRLRGHTHIQLPKCQPTHSLPIIMNRFHSRIGIPILQMHMRSPIVKLINHPQLISPIGQPSLQIMPHGPILQPIIIMLIERPVIRRMATTVPGSDRIVVRGDVACYAQWGGDAVIGIYAGGFSVVLVGFIGGAIGSFSRVLDIVDAVDGAVWRRQ